MAKGGSKIVRLKWDAFELKTVWRPNELGRQAAVSTAQSRELAAYEIDKLLGLDMVPPTVARDIDGHSGAIQFWVNGIRTYEGTRELPPDHAWSRQLSRMKVFDTLLGNSSRNLNNMLVDRNDSFVLVDFSESFSTYRTLKNLPTRFDRRLMEGIRTLDSAPSRAQLKRLLSDAELDALLARKNALEAQIERLVAERGEAAVLF
jgi:hypothetical protein